MSDTEPLVIGQQTSVTATILVIDEQLLVSSALAYTLRSLGFDAYAIHADLDAVEEAALAHSPGLVLLDLDLGSAPDSHSMDGTDLIGPLRAQGWTVMALTDTADFDRTADPTADGAANWIGKGGTFAGLVSAAVEIIQARWQLLPG
jgi:two-component system nitrate/nitrite response regulator NarL